LRGNDQEANTVQLALLYFGAVLIFAWGVGHLVPTRNVVAGFGELSAENSRIITMEWLLEGLTLCFLGVLVALVTMTVGPDEFATRLVARTACGMLVVMAVVSLFTGARTSILPMKLCPAIKLVTALAFFSATVL
jgi:hypothetical protein